MDNDTLIYNLNNYTATQEKYHNDISDVKIHEIDGSGISSAESLVVDVTESYLSTLSDDEIKNDIVPHLNKGLSARPC